jgi:hemerythrin
MVLIAWDKGLETGHALIDAQHRSLVEALNGVGLATADGRAHDGAERALLGLARITESHFRDEEGLMAAGGYPLSAEHRDLHADLLAQVRGLLERVRQDRAALTVPSLDFLKVWLVKHIKEDDRPLAGHLDRP